MSKGVFDSKAVKVGLVCALVALPFAIGLSALAVELDWLKALFSGSKWFAFKSIFGVVEILAFGSGAAISQLHRDRP